MFYTSSTSRRGLVYKYTSSKECLRGSDYFQATVSPPSAAPPHSAALFTVTPMQSDKVEQKRKSFSVKPPKNVQSCIAPSQQCYTYCYCLCPQSQTANSNTIRQDGAAVKKHHRIETHKCSMWRNFNLMSQPDGRVGSLDV